MSGAEPMAVLGAISSVIAIIETSKEIYEAAKNAKGLHASFRKASDNVAIILSTLHQAKLVQEQAVRVHGESDDVLQRLEIERESRAVEPILSLCKTNAEALSDMFASVAPNRNTSRTRRYANAIGYSMPWKKRKVQTLMRETMEGLQLLHTYHSFSTISTMGELQEAINQLPTRLSASEDVAKRRPLHQGLPRTDDAILVAEPRQSGCKNPEATSNLSEGSTPLDQVPGNVWMNANGTKVMNQIGAQTVHGSQNFTL